MRNCVLTVANYPWTTVDMSHRVARLGEQLDAIGVIIDNERVRPDDQRRRAPDADGKVR